ncbi:MAG: hypothetical protein Q9188_003797 [Gyalolechia gomerana]
MIYSAGADYGVDPGPSAGESAYLWFESPLSTLDHQSGGQKFKHMNSCESKQDQLGYYQIYPVRSIFAIFPDGPEVFKCVSANDLAGLQGLFKNRRAAPTDRDEALMSLLHFASLYGYTDICEFLLGEGADPLATLRISTSRTIWSFFDALKGDHWRRSRIWQDPSDSLIRWAECLRDQDPNINQFDDKKWTLLVTKITQLFEINSYDKQRMWELIYTVFILCLLGADVSVREPICEWQALHILFVIRRWSAEFYEDVIALAIILIRFGGADRHERFGSGESTAVDFEDWTPIDVDTITKRRNVTGDRFID